jgi:transcriptional regulator with XRE-family HTH domain
MRLLTRLCRVNIRTIFAQNLRRLRADRELSQDRLAQRVGMDRTYVSQLERGMCGATIDMVAKLADAFGVEPASMLERKPYWLKK